MSDIYALMDIDTLKRYQISIDSFIDYLNQNSIPITQYRNKSGNDREFAKDLEHIRDRYSGKLIVNDKIKFIDLSDGIHIGQDDIKKISEDKIEAIKIVRDRVGDKLIGLSTHNRDEILEANNLNIDYIGLGAYRATDTKKDASISGESLLEIAKLSTHPVAIIGGVKLSDRFGDYIRYRVIGSDICRKISNEK